MNMARTTEPVTLAGTWDVLLSHTALLGAAMIVEEELGAGAVRLRWTDEPDSRPQLCGAGLDAAALGGLIHRHATRHVQDPRGWLCSTDAVAGSLFSARTKMPASEHGWVDLLHDRIEVARPLRGLDSALVVGLGERAWWHRTSKLFRPDHGAAAWEMRTRNKGMEFIAHSLLPTGRAVAGRAVEAVTSGLLGTTVEDEPGKNKPDSRTATGMAPLGPVDAARAWVGLWALAALPVWADSHGRSVSSAHIPARRESLARLLMPVPTSWVTVARMQAALRSRYLLVAGEDATGPSLGSAETTAAQAILEEWGFAQILSFPVNVTGSASAPERRTLAARALR
ncbi:conserved hypothetical protein [Micrococcus sp. 116]|nr:conserved hypothetical protein [Micrococcus sp. 116]